MAVAAAQGPVVQQHVNTFSERYAQFPLKLAALSRFQTDKQAKEVLAGLAAVDAVVLFAESTPLAVIDALRPDVLVKGEDYAVEDIIGATEVRSWGGRVLRAPLSE